MRTLSKSRLLAYRQCAKRLWLEIHQPALKADSADAQARFDQGHEVGELARSLYDPQKTGSTLDPYTEGWDQAFARTQALLALSAPIFEASFSAHGALSLADVLLPVKSGQGTLWRMVEVKSSTGVKDYHRDDIAVQTYVARSAGLPLHSVALAHIDSSWVYPGGGDYRGLLTEVDLTDEAVSRHDEVAQWINDAQAVASTGQAPAMATGPQCSKPFECGFLAHCRSQEVQPAYPVQWLPRVQAKTLKQHLTALPSQELQDVPDELLNVIQLRVKQLSLSGETYFNAEGAMQLLRAHKAHEAPLYFLDFETIQFAVPRWAGTRPYQQIPFQFSCHFLNASDQLSHAEFLDLSGNDPSLPLAEELIKACGDAGAILAYSAGFEKSRIRELAQRFPHLQARLLAIVNRIVDLLPVAQQHYYHPDMQGSWSIKKVLPALVPSLSYDALEGVQHGGGAVAAYIQAINEATSLEEKANLDAQLRRYCTLDTYAMVRLWQVFAKRGDLAL